MKQKYPKDICACTALVTLHHESIGQQTKSQQPGDISAVAVEILASL